MMISDRSRVMLDTWKSFYARCYLLIVIRAILNGFYIRNIKKSQAPEISLNPTFYRFDITSLVLSFLSSKFYGIHSSVIVVLKNSRFFRSLSHLLHANSICYYKSKKLTRAARNFYFYYISCFLMCNKMISSKAGCGK